MSCLKLCMLLLFLLASSAFSQLPIIEIDKLGYTIYPQVNDSKPDLPSPFAATDNREFVVAVTKDNKYAIIPVTLGNEHWMCEQLVIDTVDFPYLANTGLHSEVELDRIKQITNRSLEEITRLGLPNVLSQAGFMAEDENILSVIKADNRTVSRMGLTHPQMAKPLFFILNMIDIDLSLNRWNKAKHKWEHIRYFYYNGHKVFVESEDTKGGQLSIFQDNLQGAFYIKIWRNINSAEMQILKSKYEHLSSGQFDTLTTLLRSMNTGELEPQYIMRYGFYEGHTFWRTDPIAIAFIFGLKTLPELEDIFENKLYQKLTEHFK